LDKGNLLKGNEHRYTGPVKTTSPPLHPRKKENAAERGGTESAAKGWGVSGMMAWNKNLNIAKNPRQ